MCVKTPRCDAIPRCYDHDDPEASFDIPLEVLESTLTEDEDEGEASIDSTSSGFSMDPATGLTTGDVVEVVEGELASLLGQVLDIEGTMVLILMRHEELKDPLTFESFEIRKYFEQEEEVEEEVEVEGEDNVEDEVEDETEDETHQMRLELLEKEVELLKLQNQQLDIQILQMKNELSQKPVSEPESTNSSITAINPNITNAMMEVDAMFDGVQEGKEEEEGCSEEEGTVSAMEKEGGGWLKDMLT